MKTRNEMRQALFWCAFVLYLVCTTLQFTMWTEVGPVSKALVLGRYLSFALAGVKILWDLALLFQTKAGGWSITRQGVGCGVKYALMGVLVLLVVWTSGDTLPLFVLALLLASKEVEVERIFAVALPVQTALLVLVFLTAWVGLVPDLTYVREDATVRHSLGFTYPTVVMTYWFFLLVCAMWRRKRGISLVVGIMLLALNAGLFALTDARNGFLLSAVVILVEMALGQRARWEGWAKRLGEKRWCQLVCRVVRHGYEYCGVYLSVLLAGLCVAYPAGPADLINRLLSDRIRLTAQAAGDYGIHLLGNSIQWVGYGGHVDWQTIGARYNFVDCAYALTLFNYGVVFSALVLVGLVLLGKRLYKQGNWNHCFLYLMVLGCCFIEPRLLEVHLNLVLFAAAPILYTCPKWLEGRK